MPACRSSRCQFTLRVGRIQPNRVVPTPVRANPTFNHTAGCARLLRSHGINDCATHLAGCPPRLTTSRSFRRLGRVSRFPHDQPRFYGDLFSESLRPMKPVQNTLCRDPSHLRQGLADSRQPRIVKCSSVDIVETNHRDIEWHAQSKILKCPYRTNSGHIVKGDYGSEPRPGGKEMLHHGIAQLG